jgi:hypothetical protein
VQQRLPDGSVVVQITVSEKADLTHHFQVREIRANGIGRDGKWTTLMDPVRYPAHPGPPLRRAVGARVVLSGTEAGCSQCSSAGQSHRGDCFAGDCCAGFGERGHCTFADRGCRTSEDSTESAELLQSQGWPRKLWSTFATLGVTLTAAQRAHVFDQYIQTLRHTVVLPERRERSCPRVLRQPVSSWPRKTTQRSHTGGVQIKVVRV